MSRLGRLYTTASGGSTWTERRPDGVDIDREWQCVASDSDGSNLVAAEAGASGKGRLYTSANGGVTWTERKPAGDVNKLWQAVASDDDGSVLIACVSSGRMYVSSDSGVIWAETQPEGNANEDWVSVACTSDGSTIIACNANFVYVSHDTGSSWQEVFPENHYPANISMYQVTCNGDGSILAVCFYSNMGYIEFSADGGTTWYDQCPHTYYTFPVVKSARGGTTVVTCSANGYQYIGYWYPNNYIHPAAIHLLWAVYGKFTFDVSANAGVIAYACWYGDNYQGGGTVRLSTDGGANFTEVKPEGDVVLHWSSIATDSDGSNMIVCANHYEVVSAMVQSNAVWYMGV
jgi:photosystem II stability/assembly factor-like uncharacterized protein